MRRWSLAGAALVIVVATGAAIVVPVYSEDRPQQLNLLHVDLRHRDEAHWLIASEQTSDTSAADVPATLLAAAPFAAAPALPWSDDRVLAAPSPGTPAPAPRVEVLSDELIDGERVVELRLRSPRGAHQLSLYIPETAGLRQIVVAGTPYVVDDTRPRNGFQAFHCHAVACDGMTLELSLESSAAIDLLIVDVSPGLPAGGDGFLAARPDTAVPSHDGDVTLVVDQVSLSASAFLPGPPTSGEMGRPARDLQLAVHARTRSR